ncbi:unnamed protein product [Spirodela intermedia]|uniref:Uncharacterized protein n=2 Tax=Spirodela intermedia TaxID=51605 RepID=A0A7I8JC32_SPIIN|nr:unnamed protein product [Spirodela intermedia]CAA6667680.1 unnamed protein product [Spirodela intermedia]CAA7405485.1 unnamed protein product [Spirodela intermedia]
MYVFLKKNIITLLTCVIHLTEEDISLEKK